MLLESPRHSPEDLAAWGAFERHVRLYALANRRKLAGLERRSAAALEAFGAPAWAGVSWGKDSVVMADLLTRYRPDVPLCWVVTVPGENPDCWRVRDAFLSARPVRVYREYEDRVEVAGGALQIVDDEAWPPCTDFGRRYMSGIRAEESRARRMRSRAWGESSPNTCAPLAWWTAIDVFAHLVTHDLPIHPAYACTRGGKLEPLWIRVAPLGGERGRWQGRFEWEWHYYETEMRALGCSRVPTGAA